MRAENDNSVSPYSVRNILIDLTSPGAPFPKLPAYGDTTSTPTELTWGHDITTSGDSLFIFTDSLLHNNVFSSFITDTVFSFNSSTFTNYFWRLKSIDAVGNQSGYSITSKFYVQ